MASKKLSVIFDAVDNLSAKFASAANAGDAMADKIGKIEDTSNSTFSNLENQLNSASRQMDSTATATDNWTEAIGNYDKGAMEAIYSTEELVQMGYKTEDALDATGEQAEETAEKFKQFGEESEESGEKSQSAISGLEQLIASAGLVMAIKEIGTAFLEAAADAEELETAYAKLETIAGSGSMDTLKSQITGLSSESGQAATDLADVAYNAISAGTAVEDSVDMAQTATELATSGFTDSASALSVLETAMNSYGDAAGSVEHVSDSLITVQNLGVTTVSELASQMGKGISTASAYNVSLENLESAYVSVTKAGINTAEGTTYISGMLNELGNSGSDVSKILQKETGETFGQLMNDGKSLSDVLSILYDSTNQDSEALMNLWGSQEAGKAANAIINQGLDQFNENLISLQQSAGATSTAYSTMSSTTAFAHQRMETAAENLSNTFGDKLNPALSNLYSMAANVMNGLSGFIEKHPKVVAAITAIAAAVAVIVTGIVAYTAATKIAEIATAVFNTTLLASPVTWVVAGIAALVAIVVGLGVAFSDTTEELSHSSQEQKDELDSMNAKYEETCDKYGEASDEALLLKSQVDDLTTSYEESKMTLEQFYDKLGSVCDAHDEVVTKYNETNDSIKTQNLQTDDLITKMNELAGQTDKSTASQEQMESIVGKLAEMYPDLGISIDDVNGNLDDMVNKINSLSKAQNAQSKYDNAQDTYAELVAEQSELEKVRDEAWQNYIDAGNKYADAGVVKGSWAELTNSGVASAYDEATEAYERASAALEENQALQEECTDTMAEYKDTVEGASEATVSAQDATSIAIGQTKEEISALTQAYSEAYESALDSIQGQYALWDEAPDVAATSIDKLNSSLDSQTEYWENYSDNLKNLSKRSIDGLDELVASMDDGSEKSASALAGMASASDSELKKMVGKYQDLQGAQENTATKVADMETSFKDSMGDINSTMKDSVDKMNMENDAASAAKKTIQAYINNIKNMVPDAASAAQQVSDAASKALSSGSISASVPKHADGTTDSETAYIAGEAGPELILSGGGDTVFPASETNKIVSAVSSNADSDDSSASSVSSTKTIELNINGSGSISVGAGTSKESVWENAKGSIKSAFMQILQEEIYEEGDAAYDF